MRKNKNMLKPYNTVETTRSHVQDYYAIVELKVKKKDGSMSEKSILISTKGDRMSAKNELYSTAKSMNGKVSYFGVAKNKLKK